MNTDDTVFNVTQVYDFYLASKYCVGEMTLNKIGNIMGCKNGDAVSKSVKRIKELKGKDKPKKRH